jgi:hypothetical protein
MASKTIKEVEFKFSASFDKAINGQVKLKQVKKLPAAKAKATTKAKPKAAVKPVVVKAKTKVVKAKPKAAVKPAVVKPTAKAKPPRGYTITPVQRELTLNGEKGLYDLFALEGPKMDKTRYFVDEASAKKYIAYNDSDAVAVVALSGKGFQHIKGVVSAHKDLLDAALMPELDTNLPDKCDKTSIEDTDA